MKKICPNCHQEIEMSDKFCIHCGAVQNNSELENDKNLDTTSTISLNRKPIEGYINRTDQFDYMNTADFNNNQNLGSSDTVTCNACGYENNSNDLFCYNCGNPLGNSQGTNNSNPVLVSQPINKDNRKYFYIGIGVIALALILLIAYFLYSANQSSTPTTIQQETAESDSNSNSFGSNQSSSSSNSSNQNSTNSNGVTTPTTETAYLLSGWTSSSIMNDFEIRASSQLAATPSGITYELENLRDNNPRTAYVEDSYNNKDVDIEFIYYGDSTFDLNSINIITGYAKSDEVFAMNSTPTVIDVYYNNNLYATINLQNTSTPQRVDLTNPLTLEYGDEIKFIIKDYIVNSNDTNIDIAISEVQFN